MNRKENYNIELISRCISNAASEDEKLELLNWINENEENKRAYFILKDIYEAGAWDTFVKEADTTNEWKKFKSGIVGETETPVRKMMHFPMLLKYAAVFLLGALTMFAAWRLISPNSRHESGSMAQTIITGKGERTHVILPDGSVVWLNSCSKICYDNNYNKQKRTIQLSGEAFFQVRKKLKAPFIVRASGVNVEAKGTSFNVSAYENENSISAVLTEGSIRFWKDGNSSKDIEPGEIISLSKETNRIKVEKTDTTLYTAWREGENRFYNSDFSEILKKLERAYDVKFVISNEKLKKTPFTGSFKSYESLDEILAIIQANTNMKYTRKNNVIYIKE